MTKVKYLLWLMQAIEDLETNIRVYSTGSGLSEMKAKKEAFEKALDNFRKITDL